MDIHVHAAFHTISSFLGGGFQGPPLCMKPWHVCGLFTYFVQELFENVRKEEFKIPDGDGNLAETFFNPEREGWLTKEGGKYKSKHKRWFILKEAMLYYFKQATVSE